MNFSGLELFADVRKGTMSPNDQKKGKLLQKDITRCSHTVIPIWTLQQQRKARGPIKSDITNIFFENPRFLYFEKRSFSVLS